MDLFCGKIAEMDRGDLGILTEGIASYKGLSKRLVCSSLS